MQLHYFIENIKSGERCGINVIKGLQFNAPIKKNLLLPCANFYSVLLRLVIFSNE